MNKKPVLTTVPDPVLMADVHAAALAGPVVVVLASTSPPSAADGMKLQQQPPSSVVIEITLLAFSSASTDAPTVVHDSTCPKCFSSTTTSFVTFDELTDIGSIITAIGCANNSFAD